MLVSRSVRLCLQSRVDIISIHSRKMNLLRGINLKRIGEKLSNASGAECKVRRYGRTEVGIPNIALCFFFTNLLLRARTQAVCTEAGMFALRERRIHVTQEDFEMAVAKVMKKDTDANMSIRKLWK